MRHIDVGIDEFIYLAKEAGWGPHKTAIRAWLSKQFREFVRIGDMMVRVSRASKS